MAQPYKHRSTGCYDIRRKVPAELCRLIGHEYRRSFDTSDPAEAKARFVERRARPEAMFARTRAQAAGQDVLKPGDAEQLAAQWFRAEQERLWRTGCFVDMLAQERTVTDEVTGDEHAV